MAHTPASGKLNAVYSLLADLILTLHALFIAFVVCGLLLILAGGMRGWRWVRNRWFRYAHLAAILFVVAESWFGIVCPLTLIEDRIRRAAGETGYSQSFVAEWLHRLIFFEAEPWLFAVCYTAFALLVIGVWLFFPPHRR